jgi:thioredoxin-like negative regulator of GroEL
MITPATGNERQVAGQGHNPSLVRKGGVLFRLLCLLPVACCWSPDAPARQPEELHWRFEYAEARQEAKKSGQPILLYFATQWSPQCKKMESTTFQDADLVRLVNQQYVAIKLDGMKEKQLLERLKIQIYPTIILAGPDGKILDTVITGYIEPQELSDRLKKAAGSLGNTDWMIKDLEEATLALNASEFPRAIAHLRAIVDDKQARPEQDEARRLLQEIEEKAKSALVEARQLESSGKALEAIEAYKAVARTYAGAAVQPEAAQAATTLAEKPEIKFQLRQQRAAALLEQARADFRSQQWVCCWDRCMTLTSGYSDLPEGTAAGQLLEQMKGNPDWMKTASDSMSDRLAEMYIAVAETWVHKGEPQLAAPYFEKVLIAFPGSRQAEIAKNRLTQIQVRTSTGPLKYLRSKLQGSGRDSDPKP